MNSNYYNQSNSNSRQGESTANSSYSMHGQKRDISQFVKYLLEGSGVDEGSVDFAALRQELEETIESSSQPSISPAFVGGLSDKATAVHYQDVEEDQYGGVSNVHYDKGSAVQTRQKVETSPRIDMGDFDRQPQSSNSVDAVNGGSAISFDSSPPHRDDREQEHFILESLDNLQSSIGENLGSLTSVVPKWDSINIPLPSSANSISMQSLSRLLTKSGFPPFPSHLFSSASSGSSGDAELRLVSKALFWALENVLNEYSVKSSLCEHSLSKLQQLSEQSTKLSSYFDRMKRSHVQERQSLIDDIAKQAAEIKKLSRSVESLTASETKLADALNANARDLQHFKEKAQKLAELLEREKEVSATLKDELSLSRDDKEDAIDRAKEVIALVCTHPINKRPLPVSRDVYDIVKYYEDTLRSFKYNDRRSTSHSPARSRPRNAVVDDQEKLEMFEEIRKLQSDLHQTSKLCQQAQEEKEVLKLKLLSANASSGVVDSDYEDRKRMSTHELRRKDKTHLKLRSHPSEKLGEAQSKTIIQTICMRLKIDDISTIVHSLDAVAKSIQLIPSMQNYIKLVDTLVWASPKIADTISTESLQFKNMDLPNATPHKLPETLGRIQEWRKRLDYDFRALVSFLKTVCDLLNISDEYSVLNVHSGPMKKCIFEIKSLLDNQQVLRDD